MKKRYKRFYYTLILLNVIFVVFIIQIIVYYKTKIDERLKIINELTTTNENVYNIQQNRINQIEYNLDLISNNINSIKMVKDSYVNDLALINTKIDEIINTKPEEEKLKYSIIKTLNTVLKKYYNGQKFNNELHNLKVLCKNNSSLLTEINNLNEFKDIDINLIMRSFNEESKDLIFDSKEVFLKDLIKIKKVTDKNTKKIINNNLNEIRNNITQNNLQEALKLIDKYEYNYKLKKTIELLTQNSNFINLINSIINKI